MAQHANIRAPRPEPKLHCGVHEAICILAGEPLEPPLDPCANAPVLKGFPNAERSRWLLALLTAMRALADSSSEASPPLSDVAWELERRLKFSTGADSLWTAERIWAERVASMRGYCRETGKPPRYWVAKWSRLEPDALRHLQALERRNENLRRGAQMLRAAIARDGGPHAFACAPRTGEFVEIPRSAIFNPGSRWKEDPAHLRYENEVRFVDVLVTPQGNFEHVVFDAAEIALLALGKVEEATAAPATRKRSPRKPRRQNALLDVFEIVAPGGRGAMSVKQLHAAAKAYLRSKDIPPPCDRTMRSARKGTDWE